MEPLAPNANVKYYGETKVYRALNGHTMEAQQYRFGDTGEWRYDGWSAQHSDECLCLTSDEPFEGLEDW